MSGTPSDKESLLQATAQYLGDEALTTVPITSVSDTVSTGTNELPKAPICITEEPIPQNIQHDPAAIMVGLESEIPRWQPGSVIKWTAWLSGYENESNAHLAAVHLSQAAEEWNSRNIGVTFEYVPLVKDATFVLCHGGNRGSVLASAFFPNEKKLNFLYVYTYAFRPDWISNLWKVLTHELGHVLGLRHEFANDNGVLFEGTAVQIGPRNPLSVMNYRREPPEIQESDVTATRRFYSLPEGSIVAGTPIRDYIPK